MRDKTILDILWYLYLNSDSSSPSYNYLAERYFYHHFPYKIKEGTDKYLLMKY